jgi:hypothetical protein
MKPRFWARLRRFWAKIQQLAGDRMGWVGQLETVTEGVPELA